MKMNAHLPIKCSILSTLILVSNISSSTQAINLRGKKENKSYRRLVQTSVQSKKEHEFESRIVGGVNAGENEFKFMVNWNSQCGGSLIHDQLVLTAAHCGGINGGVRIGSANINSGGITRRVTQKVRHPQYNDATTSNDYMILKLDRPVDINAYPPIQLNNNPFEPTTDEMLTVIGFGATSEGGFGSDKLKKVQIPTNSHEQCSNQYSGGIIERIHLCAGFTQGGKDSCQGDSGGPIFENRNGTPVQVGVVSFGEGCARPNRSGVYARVSGANDWIQSQICELATVNRPPSCGSSPPTSPQPPTGPALNQPDISSPPVAAPTSGDSLTFEFNDDDFTPTLGFNDDNFGPTFGLDDDFFLGTPSGVDDYSSWWTPTGFDDDIGLHDGFGDDNFGPTFGFDDNIFAPTSGFDDNIFGPTSGFDDNIFSWGAPTGSDDDTGLNDDVGDFDENFGGFDDDALNFSWFDDDFWQ